MYLFREAEVSVKLTKFVSATIQNVKVYTVLLQ